MTTASLFKPFELIDGDRTKGLVLLGDHAGRALPSEYGSLGLPAAEFDRHIAYDIGVEPLLRRLAAQTGAPAVMANFSRLLIDANRGEDDPTLIRQLYDGTIIRANYPLSPAEHERRLREYHQPYHAAVGSLIASVAKASGAAPFVFSLHSFTPAMQGRQRPWHSGVLWDLDDRAPRPLMQLLARDPAVIVGDNEPYDGALRGDTMYRHAIVNGYAHALLEVRQDLIADDAGVKAWAERLAPIIEDVNRMPDMHVVRRYGSRTGPIEPQEVSA
ncbi:N-formylglutamate amidohydrolase [Escherichia coli]|nr:N-formylglutamate amidohydrolase [Salmonella enterica subsp. enterica]EFG2885966.1 N-formylglutamate amidohydrolase [Escherichia coli]MIL10166.1 N-formylglutamate amidohydrolase [Salmonella enterica subsp. enterica serovar Enteritidis]